MLFILFALYFSTQICAAEDNTVVGASSPRPYDERADKILLQNLTVFYNLNEKNPQIANKIENTSHEIQERKNGIPPLLPIIDYTKYNISETINSSLVLLATMISLDFILEELLFLYENFDGSGDLGEESLKSATRITYNCYENVKACIINIPDIYKGWVTEGKEGFIGKELGDQTANFAVNVVPLSYTLKAGIRKAGNRVPLRLIRTRAITIGTKGVIYWTAFELAHHIIIPAIIFKYYGLEKAVLAIGITEAAQWILVPTLIIKNLKKE
jgi:hypothetical protein